MKKIHKGAEITIEDICDEFEIRRTKLYEISNHSFEWEFPNTFVE